MATVISELCFLNFGGGREIERTQMDAFVKNVVVCLPTLYGDPR